jgi:hypothetical protein
MTLIPTQVTFRGLDTSEALEGEVRERVAWLERFYGRLMRCHVLIEMPHRHHRDGRRFHVRIDLTVPGGESIVVSHEPSLHGGTKDAEVVAHHRETELDSVHRYARVAVREAFDVARRRLEDYVKDRRDSLAPLLTDEPEEEEPASVRPARDSAATTMSSVTSEKSSKN